MTAETFSYWKNKVEDSEYPALLEAERAAQQAMELAAMPQSRKKEPPLDKADEFEKYCEAYIHVGQRTAQVGKRKAADEATRKFGIRSLLAPHSVRRSNRASVRRSRGGSFFSARTSRESWRIHHALQPFRGRGTGGSQQ